MSLEKTILIVDDHAFIREGLKAIIGQVISAEIQYEVVGEAATGRDAIEMAKRHKPDICLMDISLPDYNGIALTREITALLPETRVLILSMHSKINFIADAIQAGAAGYLVKDSSPEKLMDALKWISKGESYLDSAIQTQVVEHIRGFSNREKKITNADFRTLTKREQEVMGFLAEGLHINEIAEKLFISPKTVKNHRANIMSKLNLHSHHELVRYAAKIGLIDLDLWKE